MASPAYQRRNARARALGYSSYYDYRIHNHGRIPASEPPVPRGELRSRLRGHRSAEDLISRVRNGSTVVPIDYERDPETGQFRWVEILVDDERGTARFRLRGRQLSKRSVERLWVHIQDVGALWAYNPSIQLVCIHGTWAEHAAKRKRRAA